MAENQYVNKVIYGGQTLLDLTGDDVIAADVLSGKKFHLPSGAPGSAAVHMMQIQAMRRRMHRKF